MATTAPLKPPPKRNRHPGGALQLHRIVIEPRPAAEPCANGPAESPQPLRFRFVQLKLQIDEGAVDGGHFGERQTYHTLGALRRAADATYLYRVGLLGVAHPA